MRRRRKWFKSVRLSILVVIRCWGVEKSWYTKRYLNNSWNVIMSDHSVEVKCRMQCIRLGYVCRYSYDNNWNRFDFKLPLVYTRNPSLLLIQKCSNMKSIWRCRHAVWTSKLYKVDLLENNNTFLYL